MEKVDTRKLKPEVQQQHRKQVVRLRKTGRTYKEIGEIVGIHPTNACKIFKAYEKGGSKAIEVTKRGRKVGSCRTLSEEQEKRLKKSHNRQDTRPTQVSLRAVDTRGRASIDFAAF